MGFRNYFPLTTPLPLFGRGIKGSRGLFIPFTLAYDSEVSPCANVRGNITGFENRYITLGFHFAD